MSKKKVVLTEDQRKRNAEILARLEEERVRLVEETRALQQQERRRPGRKRKKKIIEARALATDSSRPGPLANDPPGTFFPPSFGTLSHPRGLHRPRGCFSWAKYTQGTFPRAPIFSTMPVLLTANGLVSFN